MRNCLLKFTLKIRNLKGNEAYPTWEKEAKRVVFKYKHLTMTDLVELVCARASCVRECQPKNTQACMAHFLFPFNFFCNSFTPFEFKNFVTVSQLFGLLCNSIF